MVGENEEEILISMYRGNLNGGNLNVFYLN